jgi:general secretion pathway protein K
MRLSAENARAAAPAAVTQRGAALILVMWVIAFMGVLLGSFALIARTENLQSRHLFDATTAHYAAQAGLERAVFAVQNRDLTKRWVGDGRPYEFEFDTAHVRVELLDESGKIDINTAEDSLLEALFVSVGIDPTRAAELSDALQDFRDLDDIPRPHGAEADAYKAAGLAYGPRNQPFDSIAEVQQVLGMNYELYRKIEPAITIYASAPRPNPAFAPLEVLMTFPGMTEELAQQLIAARQQIQPGQPGAPPLTMPDGSPIVANAGGNTYTIKSRATLANGASSVLDASIRLGGATGRPYTVLRWRDDEASQ